MVFLRPSPNEEARMLQEEKERRRKLRLLQVREQSKALAAKTRQSVKKTVDSEYEKLAREFAEEFEQKKKQREKFLQEMYLKSVRAMGQAHNEAKAVSEGMKIESRKSEEAAVENHKTAIKRHHEALSQKKFESAVNHQNENRHIYAREKVLALEKERANMVASLPKPVDPLASLSSSLSKVEENVPKSVPVIDYDGHLGTYVQLTNAYVENEMCMEQEDGRAAATREDEKQMFETRCQMVMMQEQREKARLRGMAALQQVQIENEYESMCSQLESMKQQDLARRQANVAKISKNVFLPPHRREEEKIDHQNKLEDAFEKIYSSKPGASDAVELQMSALGTEDDGQESAVSLDFNDTARTQANPLFGVVKKKSSDLNNNSQNVSQESKDEQPLQKLLAKINHQRDQISRQNVKLIEQFEPLVPVDERTFEDESTGNVNASDASTAQNHNYNETSELVSKIHEKEVSSGSEINAAPVPYEPHLLAKDLRDLKDNALDISMEVPCRDVDDVRAMKSKSGIKSGGFDAFFEPIITSGPTFKAKLRSEACVQVGSPSRNDAMNGDLTNVTLESLKSDRDTSPVSRYLDAVNHRELSALSIEENLEMIRKKNQQLLAKYQSRKTAPISGLNLYTHRSNSSEESAPTKDVGLNRSKEKKDFETDLSALRESNELPGYSSSSINEYRQSYSSQQITQISQRTKELLNLGKDSTLTSTALAKPIDVLRKNPYPVFDSPSIPQLRNYRLGSSDSDVTSISMTSVTNSDVQTSRDYTSPPERMMKLNTNPSVCKLGPASEASVYNSMENVAYPQIGFQVPKPRFIAKAVSTVEAVDNFSAPLGNLQVKPKQQTNIFAEDFRRTYTKEISYTKDGPNIRLPSEREVSVSTASQVRERSRSPGVDTRMAGSNLGDPTIDWLLQKYKNLEIEYDNDSMETSEPFADLPPSSKSNRNPAYDRSISDLNFPENVGNNSYYDEEGRCEFSDLPTAAYNDSVEFSGGADSSYLLDNSQGVARRDIPTGRVSFGDDVINISRIESVTSKQRVSISPITDQNTTPFSLPPSGLSGSLIEIRGAGRKTSDVTIGNQDLTTVTSIQTPISQKETSSLNNTASGIGLNCDQTNPFTPETGTNLSSQASPQDHSTPHSGLEQKLDEILDTSRFSNASSKTTSSFTVVDGNEMEIVEVDFSKYASNKEQNQNMSLREERIMSPISSSGGSSKISITPESNLIQIEKQVKSNAHVTPAADISGIVPSSSGGTRSAGTMSQVQGSGSSSSMVSMSPESQLDKTLTSDQEKTPGLGNLTSNTPIVTSALAERKMNYPSQQFEPMPSIDLIDFDSTMTTSPDKAVINEDNNESNKSDDKMESGRFSISGISVGLGDHTLSPEGNSKCSNRSADTLEEQSGERLETIAPSGQSKSLDQFTNSSPETLDGDSPETNASSVSTLAVKGASEGVLESVVTFYPGKERHNLVERANLELSAINESNDTTQSSLGLMDVHAVNASLSETRMSHETSQETEAFNLIQLTQKWADQLKQYKIQTTDLDAVSNSETEEISRQIRSEPSQPMRREESGGGDSVFNRTNDSRKSDQQADVSLAEESNVFSIEQPRKGSGSCGNEEKNQVANMSDCDVSGFSLLKDRESVITATPSVDNSLKVDSRNARFSILYDNFSFNILHRCM